ATPASASAALLARELGHAVTLFVNPWQIEALRPYWFSQLDALLDAAAPQALSWDGQAFDLNGRDARLRFRDRVKDRMRQLSAPDSPTALVEEIARRLGGGGAVPDHLRCLSVDDIRALQRRGVDIQNHGWAHLDPMALTPAEFADDFARAQSWFE